MGAALQIGLALGSVLVLLGLMAVVRRLAQRFALGAELQRKLVHIGTGIYAILLPWLFPDRWPVYLLVGVTLIVMMWLRLPNSSLGRTLHGVERQSYGDLLLAVSVGLCLFLSGDQPFLYVLPIAVLTLSDAMAALVGTSYGKRFFTVEAGQKSLEGCAVFFVVTLLISIICLMLMTSIMPLNILMLSAIVAAFGTLVEAASWRGFDNLFLPMGLFLLLSQHSDDTLGGLLSLVMVFAICIAAFRYIAPRFGMTTHAAHVYVTAVFLVLAGAEAQNALFPIALLAAHIWSRSVAPGKSKFPDLDVVASLALVSFGLLALGNATGADALSFYGLITMGMMAALCALALAPQPIMVRLSAIGCLALMSYGVRGFAIGQNPGTSNWNGPMWMQFFACLGMAILVPSLWPQAFVQSRITKVTLLAMMIPMGTYFIALDWTGLWP